MWNGTARRVEAENRYLHRSGKLVSTRDRASLVRTSRGKPLYAVVHVEDIAELRRAEETLHESEVRFRTMADSCPILMWVTNAKGESQFVNRAFRELFGTKAEEVERVKWRSLVHPDDAPEFGEAFHRAVREHTPFRSEVRVRGADGEWRWIASYAEPRFSDGEFLGHVGLCPDVTERKHDEQARQFQHSLVQAIHEVSLDGILVVNEAGAVMSHNKRFLDIWRISGPPCRWAPRMTRCCRQSSLA